MFRNKQPLIIYQSEQDVSLLEATARFDVSFVDEMDGAVVGTVDRFVFGSVADIAVKILDSHGYALNLENILAALDAMKFVAVCRGSKDAVRPSVKNFTPALRTELPSKTSRGILLEKFYSEVATYETELLALRAVKRAEEGKSPEMKWTDLAEENAGLKAEITRLNGKVQGLLTQVRNGVESVTPGWALACTVRSVRVKDNKVHLSTDRGQFSSALDAVGFIPQVGAKGMCLIEGGVAREVWIYEKSGQNFTYAFAEVLFEDNKKFKCRDHERREWVVDGEGVERGMHVMLTIADGHIINWRPLQKTRTSDPQDYVQDQIVNHQIISNASEGYAEMLIEEDPNDMDKVA
jgi:hypothetical protein